MEDSDEFYIKPSQIKRTNKRQKHGSTARCGTTMRRRALTEIRKSRNHPLLVKHVATSNDWLPHQVEAELPVDDGGLSRYGLHKNSGRRGKAVRSVVAQNPISHNSNELDSSHVMYSLNKRKRWLLPEQIKDEIRNEHRINKENVDLTVVEREIAVDTIMKKPSLRPDVVGLSSSTLSDNKEDFVKRRKRKNKLKTFSWSTDLLGLSQKCDRECNGEEQVCKPEITYEVCRTRTSGPFPDRTHPDERSAKKEHKQRKQKHDLLIEADDHVTTTYINCDDEESDVTSCLKRKPLSIATWIDEAESGKELPRQINFSSRNLSSTISCKPSSKKGRVFYKPYEGIVIENNKRNSGDVLLADAYFQQILEDEKSCFIKTQVSMHSLVDLNGKLWGNEGKNCVIQGLTATRSCTRPLLFAFQMNDQAAAKQGGETTSSYLILQPLSDPGNCSNKEDCFQHNGFCVCNQYLPVKIKVTILSAEENNQKSEKAWREKVKEIFSMQNSVCPQMNLKKILSIVANAFTHIAQQNWHEQAKENKLRLRSNGPILKSKREVVDHVSTLLGFSCNPITEARFNLREREGASNAYLITNHTLKDFCEICWSSLSDESGEYQSLSLHQCGHSFCHDCWIRHVTTLTRSSATQALRCPGFCCHVIIDDVTLMNLLSGDVLTLYQNRLLKRDVQRSKNFHQCPQCNKIVEATNTKHPKLLSKAVPLSCACGARWCSGCWEEPHWPASCADAAAYWKEVKELNDKSIVRSINGKRCPACREVIEKNGGCTTIYCVCGFTFCWNCLVASEDCTHFCYKESLNLESWNLNLRREAFVRAVQDAAEENKVFESLKTHRRRLAACKKRSSKIIVASTPMPHHHDKHVRRQMESRLNEMLLHSDALHYILQYLTIFMHGLKNGKGRCSFGKVRRFFNRMQLSKASIEQSIFDEKPAMQMKMSQLMEKKIIASKTLIFFLISCLNRLPSA